MLVNTNQTIIYRPVFKQNSTAMFHFRNAKVDFRSAMFHFLTAMFHFLNAMFHFLTTMFHFLTAMFHSLYDRDFFHNTTNQHFSVLRPLTTTFAKSRTNTNRTEPNKTNFAHRNTKDTTAANIGFMQ